MTAEDIIQDLLDNPYPHDLIQARLKASKYSSEEAAKKHLTIYCTTEFAMKARADWQSAQAAAKEWLKNKAEKP